jgi:hypothetical protein
MTSVLMAVGLLAYLAVLMSPAAIVTVLALLPSLSGLRRGFPIPEIRLTELIAVALFLGVAIVLPRNASPRWRVLDTTTVLYALTSMLIVTWHLFQQGQLSAALTAAGPLQYLAIYATASFVATTPALRALSARVLLISSIPVNLVAFLQAANVPGVRVLIESLTDYDAYYTEGGYAAVPRATSILSHWHVLAGFNAVVVLLAIAFLLDGSRRVMPRWSLVSVAVCATCGLAVSVTATAALGLALASLVVAGSLSRIKKMFRLIAPGLIIGLVVFWPVIFARIQDQGLARSDRTGTLVPAALTYRWEIWVNQYFPAVLGSPLTGYGPILPDVVKFPFTESVYLSLLMRGGALLLAAYLLWMGSIIYTAKLSLSRFPSEVENDLARVLLGVSVALVPMQLLFPYLLASGVPQVFWLIAGLVRSSLGQRLEIGEDPEGRYSKL